MSGPFSPCFLFVFFFSHVSRALENAYHRVHVCLVRVRVCIFKQQKTSTERNNSASMFRSLEDQTRATLAFINGVIPTIP